MANNYCLWSFAFGPLSDVENKWAYHRLKYLEKDWEEDITDVERRAIVDAGYDENATSLEFDWRTETDLDKGLFLIMYSDESGNLENVVAFLQELLKRFNRKDIVTITWADTCDKMRPDNFSGGGVVVTANEARWMSSSVWVYKVAKLIADKWQDDKLQFARLICEIMATQDNLNVEALCVSMDLDASDLQELFERANTVWEKAKEAIRG